MCRVLEPGYVAQGDRVVIEHQPDHGVTIGTYVTGIDADGARRSWRAARPCRDPCGSGHGTVTRASGQGTR